MPMPIETRHLRLCPALAVLLLCLAGCASNPRRDPVVGEAFVGPASLQLRQELSAKALLVATVHHGDRLAIIGRRRRFVKVRTASDAEGWVDGRQLLTTADMNALKQLAAVVAKAPGQGEASVFENLNVHTVPNRQSPSFFQIAQNKKVMVVAYQRTPRIAYEPPEPVEPRPAGTPRKKERRAKEQIPPPPPAPPPPPPQDWIAMSGHPDVVQAAAAHPPAPAKGSPPKQAAPTPAAPPTDSWALVRTEDGRAGWVLTRMLIMGVPDEIAQYAERARISAWFVVGKTVDRGETHPAYLWCALAQQAADYQFDSLRVFSWNGRRHRYETSFIERGLRGWLPLQLVEASGGGASGFRVVVEEKDGRVVERQYSLLGFRARVTARRPASLPEPWYRAENRAPIVAPAETGEAPAEEGPAGLFDRLRRKFKH